MNGTTVELPRPIDVRAALAEVVARLRPIGGDFALVGGVAMGVYGVERFTRVVALACTVAQTTAATHALSDQDPRALPIGGVSVATSVGVRVDLIDRRLDYQGLFEAAIAEARDEGVAIDVDGYALPVVTMPYLVVMKLIADRPQDEVGRADAPTDYTAGPS